MEDRRLDRLRRPPDDRITAAGTGVVNRYLDKVFRACNASVPVADQTLRVQNLLARPESLITPAMALRVLLAARSGAQPR